MRYNDTLDLLNRQDLKVVMEGMGHTCCGVDNTRAHFVCPFHDDHNPSFSVSLTVPEGYTYQTFLCHVCKKSGSGAVRLVQELMKRDGQKHEHLQLDAMRKVAQICGLSLDLDFSVDAHYEEFVDEDYTSIHDRFTKHYSSIRKEAFSSHDLAALGLVSCDMSQDSLTAILHDQFHCYAITDCRYADDRGRLHHTWSTDDYPIFEFEYAPMSRYADRVGEGSYIRKYEPFFEPLPGKPNYKNAYFSEVGTEVSSDVVYGDQALLDILSQECAKGALPEFKGARALTEAKRLLWDADSGKMKMQRVKVLKSIVICSGQKDAINVYLNSDAHVLYPHSETSTKGLNRDLVNKLLVLAERVYVCFDSDEAGIRAQNALCLRHLELRPVRLPGDLRTLKNARGRQCKDITEYFTIYCPKFSLQPRFSFRQMLMQSKSLKFWNTRIQRHRTEEQGEYDYESKFEFDAKSLARFLDANGFRGIWSTNANGLETVIGFMHMGPYHSEKVSIGEQQVNIIQFEDASDYIMRIIQHFFAGYNLNDDEAENLENAFANQRKVGDDAIRQFVSSTIMDIKYWVSNDYRKAEPGVYYIFCRNKAVRISKEDIRLVDYRSLPFMVNVSAISKVNVFEMDDNLRRQIPQFAVNPEYEQNLLAYQTKKNLRTQSIEERNQMTKSFNDYKRLWHHIRVSHDYRMPDRFPIFQIEEGVSRLYWEKEEDGYLLTKDERQMHDAMLFNRMNNIGYMLTPYRTGGQIQFVVFVDYDALSREASSGGTGKSTILNMVNIILPVYNIKGNSMKYGADFSRNFDGFVSGYHGLVGFDETHERFKWNDMKGMENGIDIKQLYHDTVRIPFDESPKMAFCTNYAQFNLNDDSTARRVAICPVSSYFHPESSNGMRDKRNYTTEFGHDPIKEASPEELNAIVWYFATCIQLFCRTNEIFNIPTDKQLISRFTSAIISDEEFNAWAQQWFSQDCHFCRPIAITEMQLSFAKWKNSDDFRGEVVRRSRSQFMEMVELYIKTSGIQRLGLENAAIRGRANGTAKYPDRNCWVTPELNGFYQVKAPRIIRQSDCCYFYRETDKIPLHSKDVLTCGETDPELDLSPS